MNNKAEYGVLFCPNCRRKGMNKYTYWSSKRLYGGTKQWLFYNKNKIKKGWKCWSIFEICGKTTKNWYDPCDCCFNPLKVDKETVEKSKAKELLGIVIIRALVIYFLYAFIYIGYIFLFLWFDIFYFLCYKEKYYEILMHDGQIKTIPVKDGLWQHFEKTGYYTSSFWENNFPNLFKCEKCCYKKNTFKEFLRNEGNMVVNNNQDTGTHLVNITDSNILPN